MTMAMGSAMASPRSRSLSDAVWNVSPTRTLPPTRTSGASRPSGDVLDPVGDRELLVLVEVAGEGHHDQRRAAVGGAQRLAGGSAGPGVGDVEDAVDGRDARQVGGDAALDLRVVDVDAVGDDGQLPAGLGQVVELVSDAPGLGGAPGAEVGRQDARRRSCRRPRCRRRAATQVRMTARRRRTTKRPTGS